MENKSNSLVNLTTVLHQNHSYSLSKRKLSHSNSLPNLHTSEEEPHNNCCSPCSSPKPVTTPSSPNHKVIPHILQKTWNKIKSMNSKKTTANSSASGCGGISGSSSSSAILNSIRPINSAPSTPSSLQKFEFDDEELIDDPVRENYAKLQKRLSEELHQGQIQIGKNSHSKSSSGHNSNCVSGEFKKKLIQWEMWKASCGKAHYTDEELKLILPEDFSKKLKEWENIRSGSPCQVANVKIEKQIQWLDKQLEKVEQEKGKLEAQMQKFLEKEARLQTMKESLKNYTRDNALIKIKTATGVEGFIPVVDEKFTKKMFESEETKGSKVYMACREVKKCEKTQEIIVETSSPIVYCRHCDLSDFDSASQTTFKSNENRLDILIENAGSSSTSSEVQESEDTQEISHEELEPNTPVSSSSLESINDKAGSGSNTSNASADFYQKNRRRSSDSTPLSARSPSLSAFTSDDEENSGLLKTVEEEEAEEKQSDCNIAPPPIVQVNQIVVEEEESEITYPSNAIVPTKRTLIKPIMTETSTTTSSPPSSSSTLKDLHSSSLVKCITDSSCTSHSSVLRSTTTKANNNQGQVGSVKDPVSGTSSSSSGTSTSPTSKIRVEDVWNKNIDASPPPGRNFPRIVGVIHKSSSHNLPPLPTSVSSSTSSSTNASGMGMTTSSTSGLTTTTTTPTGRNFPRMGKIPLSPLFARRRLASTSTCVNTTANSSGNDMTSAHSLSTSTLSPYNFKRPMNNNNEFSLDRFLETSNLSSTVTSRIEMNNSTATTSNSSKNNTEDTPSPLLSRKFEGGPMRFINLSRSNSFGMTKLPSSRLPLDEEEVESSNTLSPPKVCKSKSTSSVFKSSLSLFSKVQKSDNSNSSSSSKKGTFLGNRWRAQF